MSKNDLPSIMAEKQRNIQLTISMHSQVEAIKMHCVEHCFDLKTPSIDSNEKNCYIQCMEKAKNYLERTDRFYMNRYF